MTVTASRLKDLDLTTSSDGTASGTVEWYVDVSDSDVGFVTTLTQAETATPHPVPKLASVWNFDGDQIAGLYLDSLRIRRQVSPRKLKRLMVTGEYITPPIGIVGPQNPDPLQRPAVGWLEFTTETESVSRAYLASTSYPVIGDLGAEVNIVNAAGQSFDTPLFEDYEIGILVQQRNYATLDEIYAIHKQFDRTVNRFEFYSFPAHHAQFRGITTGPPQTVTGTTFYSATVRVALGRKPFYREIVNYGWEEKLGSGKLRPIMKLKDPNFPAGAILPDGGGVNKKVGITEPANLTNVGLALPDGILGNSIPYLTRDAVNYDALGWIGLPRPPDI